MTLQRLPNLLLAPSLGVDPAEALVLVVAAAVEELVVREVEGVAYIFVADAAVDALGFDD